MRTPVFSPSFGNRPSYLVGRESVIRDFLDGISKEPGNRERAVVMLGQRGMGKTVLLWELADRAAEQGFVVATPTVASDDMLDRIIEKIQESGKENVRQRGTHLSGASVGAFGFTAGLEFSRDVQETKSFQYKLTQLVRTLNKQGHGVLILVDELQANSPEIRQLVTAYQELVGERADIAIVLAGLPGAVSATLNDKVLTFLYRARKITLDPLTFSEVDAFYERAFEELDIAMPDELRREAAYATQGSPYLLQLIGYNIELRVPKREEVTESALKAAVAASEEDFKNDVCRSTIATLSDKDREFLAAMSQDDGASKTAEVGERMGVTSDYAQKYRRRLIDAGVIQPAGRGYVEYAVPYLSDFMREEFGE